MVADNAPRPDEWDAVYAELRKRASRHLRRYAQATLSTTTLAHEAYIRLAQAPDLEFESLEHYLHTASQAMRWILVESARSSRQGKRGGWLVRVELREDVAENKSDTAPREELLSLSRAIRKLFELDKREGHVVVMRALGMSIDEIAAALEVSRATVKRDWRHALGWLYQEFMDPAA